MFKLIDETSSIEHGGDDGVLSDMQAINELKFENVAFNYPSRKDVQVLKGISFSIEKSQKVAFVGESGSGKSTIVQLLERFYDPQGGSVLVNGKNLADMPVYAWRRVVGYVGQEPVLFATTVLENIRMSCPEATEADVRAAAKQAEALAFLDKMPKGLSTYVGQGGGQLSGGQKQRIAIARALVKKPVLLILDEATSALDNESEKLVQQTLDGLQQHGDLTIVTIAHRLSTIRNSDKIFVLAQGVLAESGTHKDLVNKKGVYFKLTEAQAAADGVGAEGEKENPDQFLAKRKSSTKSKFGNDDARDAKTEKKSEEDTQKERLKEIENWNPPLSRIFKFADPVVKLMWPLALLACLIDGCAMPLQGWILSEAMFDFFLPYECPPPDNDAYQLYQCKQYEPAGTASPLKREAYKNALFFLAIAILQFVSIFMKQSTYRWIQERMTKNLRKEYFRCLLSQEIGFFDDPTNSAGGLTAALAKQTQLVAGITGISLGQMIGSTCALLLGIVLAFVACWRVALAMLGAVPLVGGAMALVTKVMYTDGGAGGQGAYSESGAIASEAVLNIKTVRACRAEKQVLGHFNSKLQAIVKKKTSESAKSGFAYGFGMAIIFILYVICFSYGPYNVDEGFCDGEEMFKALFCMMFGAMGAGMGAIFMQDADKAKLAAYDMLKIMDRESKVNPLEPRGCTEVQSGKPSIIFEKVSFFYPHRPEVQVLKNFSVSVNEGQTVALVGPSGSGKSTIVQLLMRFYDVEPGSGSITVGGMELRSLDVSWWRSCVGLVGQEPVLFDASLEDNVKYGKTDATRADVDEAAALASMDFVLTGKIQWEDSVGARGGKLSGGQKQRVAIARALLRKPKILLLDEATSALDSTSEQVVQEALDNARKGRTTFVIAHRLSTIRDSDLILVMCDGTVTEQGTHEQLLAKQGLYWTLQQKAAA
jgi:ABC-type multidrug transport system fused ATPase/permease subunit